MGIRYLAYGSNLHPRRLRERTPSARLIGTAEIPGWHLSFTKRGRDGSGKCTISNGGDGVHCAIYEMSRQDKKELDAIDVYATDRSYWCSFWHRPAAASTRGEKP